MKKLSLCFVLSLLTATMAWAQETVITVAQDGTGDYTTIQAAIDAAADNAETTIEIKAGTYQEQLCIGSKSQASTKRLNLIGEGMDKTIVTSAIGMSSDNTTFDKTPAISFYANDCYAENITFQNTAGRAGGQALAIYVAGDRNTFYRCKFAGYQDTHRTKKNTRSYYKECVVEGATDYIYAGGTCWFERCTLNCVGGGYITAPEDITAYVLSESGKYIRLGFIFNECTVTKAAGVADGSIYLGRCWGVSKCGSLFMKCNLGRCIAAAGWSEMGGNTGKASYYAEYKNTDADGNLVDTSKRISWSFQLTDADYAKLNTWAKVDEQYRATVGGTAYDPEAVIASHQRITADDYAEPEQKLLAFPTARGFGKYARGGRGGKVVEVTNLNDDGEGSFRWALTTAGKEDATIVFRVSGIIDLKSDVRAKLRNVTIAGQTAPGMGILYRGAKLNLGGSNNLIMRNIRGRIGLKNDTEFIKGGSIGIENADTFIIDHCCFGWSGEENMTIYDNHFSTVQWTIVHEGLYDAGHQKGDRSYGSQWGGSPATYHHNLLAHNVSRSPRINGASNSSQDRNVFLEYYNNVNYNWAKWNACYGGENEAGSQSSHECNFVGNYYKPGPGSASNSKFISISNNRSGKTSAGPSRWYFEGNKMVGNTTYTNNNWSGVDNGTSYTLSQLRSDTLITTQLKYYWPRANQYDYADYQTPTESADEAYAHVLARVGTVNRDAVEQRIVEETANKATHYKGTAYGAKYTNMANVLHGFIDSPADADGWPEYPEAAPATDDDHDGMADDWELQNGFDPTNPDDRNRIVSAEGYTALEVYLNSLMGETIPLTTAAIQTVSAPKSLKEVALYDLNGVLLKQAASADALDTVAMPAGIYIVRKTFTDHTLQAVKMVKR